MQRHSPTESMCGSARYDPVSKQARVTSRPAVITSAAAPGGFSRAAARARSTLQCTTSPHGPPCVVLLTLHSTPPGKLTSDADFNTSHSVRK
jgi:hypothetical protein